MYSIREERFVCPYCGDTGPTLSGTDAHVVVCAHNPINHMCASCVHVGRISSDGGADIECLCRHESGADDVCWLYVPNTCKCHTPRDPSGKTAYKGYKFKYICPHCGLHMGDMSDMLQHIDKCIHNPDADKTLVVCRYCGLSGSALDISTHMQICQNHPGNKRCKTCRHFVLDSSREVSCCCPSGTMHMLGLHHRCDGWDKHATVVWLEPGVSLRA
jgi:hypothetical protein